MINKDLYIKHAEQAQENPCSSIRLVENPEKAEDFERESGKSIGVIDNQPYYNINLDLYQDKESGRLFRYCNVEYTKHGSATLVVFKADDENGQDLYLFEKHFRPFTNSYHYEIPRGFADADDLTSKITAIREVEEETGIVIEVSQLISLGTMFTDTGLTNSEVNLFVAELKADSSKLAVLKNNDTSEEIHDFICINRSELVKMINENKLTDSFSLVTILKYWNIK